MRGQEELKTVWIEGRVRSVNDEFFVLQTENGYNVEIPLKIMPTASMASAESRIYKIEVFETDLVHGIKNKNSSI